jgi:hypothetical protein
MTRILCEHGNFNRISFGASLWTSIIRPSFAHGCAVWFPSAISNAQNIEHLQYQAGTIILKTKVSFSKSALLSVFGWEPINEFLDRQRVNYFARFDELPVHRLCKIVFLELKKFRMCGMEVCKLYEKYFPVNRIRLLLLWKF